MTEFLAKELSAVMRYLIVAIAAVICTLIFTTYRQAPVSTTVQPAETRGERASREVQGGIRAAQQPGTSYAAQPAVDVVGRVLPMLRRVINAEVLAATQRPTREVIAAESHLVRSTAIATPSPGPFTKEQIDALVQADKAAVADVLADPQTHIATTVEVKREEVQPTRIGSIFTPNGAGIDFALVRKGHFEFDAGAIIRGQHLSLVISPEWVIPHTSLGCGPSFAYDHRVIIGAACTAHFGSN